MVSVDHRICSASKSIVVWCLFGFKFRSSEGNKRFKKYLSVGYSFAIKHRQPRPGSTCFDGGRFWSVRRPQTFSHSDRHRRRHIHGWETEKRIQAGQCQSRGQCIETPRRCGHMGFCEQAPSRGYQKVVGGPRQNFIFGHQQPNAASWCHRQSSINRVSAGRFIVEH